MDATVTGVATSRIPVGTKTTLFEPEVDEVERTKWKLFVGNARFANLVDPDRNPASFTPQAPGRYLFVLLTQSSGDRSETYLHEFEVFSPRLELNALNACPLFASIQVTAKPDLPDGTELRWSVEPASTGYLTVVDANSVLFVPEAIEIYQVRAKASFVLDTPLGPTTQQVEESCVVTVIENTSYGAARVAEDWQKIQTESRSSILEKTQTAAGKWDAAITGFLALFGSVSFLAAPSVLKDIGSQNLGRLILLFLASAMALAFVARYLLAVVAGPIPRTAPVKSPLEYREQLFQAGYGAAERVREARGLAVGSALLVVVAALLASWSALGSGPSQTPTVVVRTDKSTVCGPATRSKTGELLIANSVVGQSAEIVPGVSCPNPDEEPDVEVDSIDRRTVAGSTVLALLFGVLALRNLGPKLAAVLGGVGSAALFGHYWFDTQEFPWSAPNYWLFGLPPAVGVVAFSVGRALRPRPERDSKAQK